MFRSVLIWLGLAQPAAGAGKNAHAGHAPHGAHGHTHGVMDATIASTARGIWAIKWSFAILAVTSALQFAVVLATGSVALLADTIHNVGDAVTAVPLGIAFMLTRRKPSARFTYGYGRTEDLAGVAIVLIILVSAIVAAYEAIDRLLHPQPIQFLGWVIAAGIIGFLGNEAVAVFRIRIGREINSAALIADGYHARTDGLTSLAVVVGAAGVWFGFPLADPLIGLLITLAIFVIVWQSAKAVFTRMLDGVEPGVTDQIRHAAGHVPGVRQVLDVRARWIGHRLNAELDLGLDGATSLAEADAIASRFEQELFAHMPALSAARIRVRPYDDNARSGADSTAPAHAHAHAPAPVAVTGRLAEGMVTIVDTAHGERLRFVAARAVDGLQAHAEIGRSDARIERLTLRSTPANPAQFDSERAPDEPHAFDAALVLSANGRTETLPFSMVEPADHHAAPGHG